MRLPYLFALALSLQWFLAHKEQSLPRTIQYYYAYMQGPMEGVVSHERGTPVESWGGAPPFLPRSSVKGGLM